MSASGHTEFCLRQAIATGQTLSRRMFRQWDSSRSLDSQPLNSFFALEHLHLQLCVILFYFSNLRLQLLILGLVFRIVYSVLINRNTRQAHQIREVLTCLSSDSTRECLRLGVASGGWHKGRLFRVQRFERPK